jgi:hypothetical protein
MIRSPYLALVPVSGTPSAIVKVLKAGIAVSITEAHRLTKISLFTFNLFGEVIV